MAEFTKRLRKSAQVKAAEVLRHTEARARALEAIAWLGAQGPGPVDVEALAEKLGAEIVFEDLEGAKARVIQLGTVDTTGARLFLSARAVPSWSAQLPAQRAALSMGQESVGCFCPAGTPNPTEAELFLATTKAAFSLAGFVLQHIWEVMSRSAEQVATDVRHLHDSHWSAPPAGMLPSRCPLAPPARANWSTWLRVDNATGGFWRSAARRARRLPCGTCASPCFMVLSSC